MLWLIVLITKENCQILREYSNVILYHFKWIVDFTINLISVIYYYIRGEFSQKKKKKEKKEELIINHSQFSVD